MKKNLPLILVSLFYSITVFSQASKFKGIWTSDTNLYVKNPDIDSLFPDYSSIIEDYSIQIKNNISEWHLLTNQLYMEFSNKVIKDTLFLFFKNYDVGRGFMSFKGSFPKVQSLFAKCYIAFNGQLSITYINRSFIYL